MPNLLAINNYHYLRGGAETVFFDEMRLMKSADWQVAPFCMQHPDNLESIWSEHFVDEIEFENNYPLLDKITKVSKSIYSFEARNKLANIVKAFGPDIAHLHNIYHHISPSILSELKEHHIPSVLTVHDLKIACPAYKMLASDGVCERCLGGKFHNVVKYRCMKNSLALSLVVWFEANLHQFLGSYVNNVDKFIVPSAFYGDKLQQWGINPNQLVHIPNALNPDDFAPDFTPGGRFVFAGRLAEEKGVATLIEAAAHTGIPLTIVGTGPLNQELQTLANNKSADVDFTGYLTGDALKEQIRHARALVLPSEWYENAPMSVLEAYALGTPVIGADIGGIPELIEHGVTGFTFESGSSESLATQLRNLQSLSEDELSNMGRYARSVLEDKYNISLHQDKLLQLYHSLMA